MREGGARGVKGRNSQLEGREAGVAGALWKPEEQAVLSYDQEEEC